MEACNYSLLELMRLHSHFPCLSLNENPKMFIQDTACEEAKNIVHNTVLHLVVGLSVYVERVYEETYLR
jgi:hypothetical protein